jgi:hypothetical protein
VSADGPASASPSGAVAVVPPAGPFIREIVTVGDVSPTDIPHVVISPLGAIPKVAMYFGPKCDQTFDTRACLTYVLPSSPASTVMGAS